MDAIHSHRIRLVTSGTSSCGTCPATTSSKRVAGSRADRSRKYFPTGPVYQSLRGNCCIRQA